MKEMTNVTEQITTNDAALFGELLANRKAYGDGVYDFTYDDRFLVYHCRLCNELHYIAIDNHTGRGSEICRDKKAPVAPENFASLIPALEDSVRYARLADVLRKLKL